MGDNGDKWTPAMMIPWSVGRNYSADYDWAADEGKVALPQAARSALLIGLLTEDNLPWYAETIDRKFGENDALNFWNRVWTAEEDRHADVMRTYMSVAHLVDPAQLDEDRMAQIISAEVPNPPSVAESMVYVAIQELATRISHQNTGKLIADTAEADQTVVALSEDRTTLANVDPVAIEALDPDQRDAYVRQVGRAIMTRVAGDENKHFAFYADMVGNGAIPIDPSTVVKAIELQIRGFQMPGTGIREFMKHAIILSEAGMYDARIHHSKILAPILKRWKFEEITGLDDDAERSRERTLVFMDQLDTAASEFEEKREERRAAAADDPETIWVGKQAA
jgi:acyl-[acyl-carrier-protein] desaturase